MGDQAAITRSDAIETFAVVLRDVRSSAGNPSFREMSGRSRAISHTTLHEAAQGNRLPSWSTTVEFVKACGADPADFRERWDDANRAVASAVALRQARPPLGVPARALTEHLTVPTGFEPPVAVAADAVLPSTRAPSITVPSPRRPRGRYVAFGVAAIGLLVAGVVVAARGDGRPAAGEPVVRAQFSSADCPVRQANPPAATPRHKGDVGAFISDITLPDCSHITHGTTVTKVWRFKNIGTVPWIGYSLHRIDLPQRRDQCQTISDIAIADTRPGEMVDIRKPGNDAGGASTVIIAPSPYFDAHVDGRATAVAQPMVQGAVAVGPALAQDRAVRKARRRLGR